MDEWLICFAQSGWVLPVSCLDWATESLPAWRDLCLISLALRRKNAPWKDTYFCDVHELKPPG
eukprot:4245658-Pleurochrysis_carterae.AAC.1